MRKYLLFSIIVLAAWWVLSEKEVYGASSIVINSSQVRQKIEGMGGNYPFGYDGDTAVSRYTLDNLKPKHVRVFFYSHGFEPINDDSDPFNFNWPNFQYRDVDLVNGQFLFLQDLKNRGISEDNIVLSPWKMPEWMIASVPPHIIIPANMYDEAIEVIAATLIRARDIYRVSIKYIQFNEPNASGDWDVYFSPTEMCNFIKKAGPRFVSLGLNVKWLAGDTYNAATLVNYVQPQLADAECRQYLGPVDFHSWWDSGDDNVLANIYNLASQYGLPVWCEEIGTYASDTDDRTSWSYALNLAELYHRLLRFARVSATAYWIYGSWDIWDPVNNSTMIPYPSFYVLKQLSDNLPVGTDIVEANSSDSELLVLAGKKDTTGHFMVQVINTGASKDVSFSGLPNGNFTLVRTSASENIKTISIYQVVNGNLTLNLAGQSINTLVSSSAIPSLYCGDSSCNGEETCSTCPADCGQCPVLSNNSQFVSQNVPSQMTAGSNNTVNIAIKNTGTSVWTESDMYRLGSQNPYDNTNWGMDRILLGSSEAINPDQTKTFTFSVTAPTTPGTYNFQWRMVRELVEWFGELTPNISIAVVSQATPFCGDSSCNGTETCLSCSIDCGTCPTTPNLALNKLATASSAESSSFSANLAFDGNVSTRWSSSYSDPQWLQVDLEANYSVNQVILRWEVAFASAYQIQVSANGTTWTNAYSKTNGTDGAETINLTPVSARYVRMYGTQRATSWGYSLWEFEIYGSSVSSTDTTPPAAPTGLIAY